MLLNTIYKVNKIHARLGPVMLIVLILVAYGFGIKQRGGCMQEKKKEGR